MFPWKPFPSLCGQAVVTDQALEAVADIVHMYGGTSPSRAGGCRKCMPPTPSWANPNCTALRVTLASVWWRAFDAMPRNVRSACSKALDGET